MKKTDRAHSSGFYVRWGVLARWSVILAGAAGVFCLLGSAGLWRNPFTLTGRVLLPLGFCLLFALLLPLLGRRALWLTVIPLVLGIASRLLTISGLWSGMITVVLCLGALVLTVLTFSGRISSKAPLVGFYPAVIGYRAVCVVFPAMRDFSSLTFSQGMQELSLLCGLGSLLLMALAMKKKEHIPCIEDIPLPAAAVRTAAAPTKSKPTEEKNSPSGQKGSIR